jgi:predicted ATP-dependent endonuclease of OLD family
LKALIPQPLLPSLGEGEPEPQAESLAPSPKLWPYGHSRKGEGWGEGFQCVCLENLKIEYKAMKIQVENLGPLKQAEFEVADFTIICGSNNTGKTYATYALFGFLHTWKKTLSIDMDDSVLQSLQENGGDSVDIEKYIKQSQEIVNSACEKYSSQIVNLFAASPEALRKARFNAVIPAESSEYWNSLAYEDIIESEYYNQPVNITITKKHDNSTVTLYTDTWSIPADMADFCFSLLNQAIRDILFARYFPSTFIASVERTGISIFRKEIDSARDTLLEEMSKSSTSERKLNLFQTRYQNYPLPIQFGLNFNRAIGGRYQSTSFITKDYPGILDDFADIIGGEYHFNDHDEIRFSPKDNPNVRLSIYESSSAVRSLLDLGFYLRHQAQQGSLLIIDEPELNLHPENQRRIARLLARLVNIGIKVFITTHSDYIIKELNTLIMLNHDKPHLKRIAEEEGYKPEELIAAERIKVYIAENATLVPANIDPVMGIEARSFDTTIEDMNRIQEAIVWGE